MDKLKLYAQREEKAREYRNLLDRNPGKLDNKTVAQLNKLESEIKIIDEQVAHYDKLLQMTADEITGGRIPGSNLDAKDALKALTTFARTGSTEGLGIRNAFTEGDNGFLVPEELEFEIISIQKNYSPLRQICQQYRIETAASKYTLPVNLGGTGTGWVGETDARPATGAPGLVSVDFPDAEVYANLPISQWFLDDRQIGSWFETELAKEFSRVEAVAFISGSGTKQPKGFLTYPTATTADATRDFGTLQHVAAASPTGFLPDELIELCYSLKGAYRQQAHWVMNAATLAKVRKLKDSSNRYLWEPGLSGQQQTLLGYPILECDDMPDVAAEALPIAFGDFRSGYLILDQVINIMRDPYSNKPYVNFYGRKRLSGAVIDSNAIKVLKMAAAG